MHTRLDQVRIKSGVEDADEILNSDNSLSLLSSEKVKEEDYHVKLNFLMFLRIDKNLLQPIDLL
jgi:hypothetical protein